MALPAAGSAISFKDINEELGNNSQAELDLKTAAETFGDTQPFGMNELAGLSSSRLQLTIKYLVQMEQGESDRDTGWISTASSISSTKGELVLCAEAAAPADDVRSRCWAELKSNVTTLFAEGDDEVVLILGAFMVIVVIPADPVVIVAPDAKLIAVRDVPTDDPALFTSTPDTTPLSSLPSP